MLHSSQWVQCGVGQPNDVRPYNIDSVRPRAPLTPSLLAGRMLRPLTAIPPDPSIHVDAVLG